MQDPEYLYFGIWASDPNNPTAAHDFKWIAGGGNSIDATHFGALTGRATFNGGAVGRYALRNQVGQDDRMGTFTANATFTADFDIGSDGSAGSSLSGNITDFREGGTPLAGWSVYLGSSASAAATLDQTGATGTLIATASIGGVSVTGDWAATLYGSNNPGFDDFDGDAGDVACPVSGGCPSADLAGVSGWFDAISPNAAIAGTFAAAP